MSEIRFTPSPEQALQQLRQFPQRTLNAIATVMDDQNELTVSFIIERKLSAKGPDTLGVVAGHLRRSIRRTKPRVLATSVESSIGSNIEYAVVHEFGAKPHIIRAKNGKALKFAVGGRFIFRKEVKHPGAPERAFVRRSIEARRPDYVAAYSKAIQRTWEGS